MPGAQRSSSVLGIHHLAIEAQDFESSLHFYVHGLGCHEFVRFVEDGRTIAFLKWSDGTSIELWSHGTALPQRGPLLHLALRTDDCASALERAAAAGATVTIPPTAASLRDDPPMVVRYAFCTGPDGEEIEFLESDDL